MIRRQRAEHLYQTQRLSALTAVEGVVDSVEGARDNAVDRHLLYMDLGFVARQV